MTIFKNKHGTFYFKCEGYNIDKYGMPIMKNLHREDGPAVEWDTEILEWFIDGQRIKIERPKPKDKDKK